MQIANGINRAVKRDIRHGNGNGKGNGLMENRTGLTLATWNIRSINDKETELVQEFEQADLDILAITETKRKGRHVVELENGHTMILSGVKNDKRAQGGVGCIIRKNLNEFVTRWDTISERIMLLELRMGNKGKMNVLILYGPNEDDKAEVKDRFWGEVTEIMDEIRGDVVILGDLNGRVGKQDQRSGDVIGNHGEMTRNNNGTRVIDFCIENNLLVMNTFYRHKDVHKYTREVKSRNERSIIDYVIASRNLRQAIQNVRVRRGPEINSDHYMVIARTKIGLDRVVTKNELQNNTSREVIKSYKLNNKEVAERYRSRVNELIEATSTSNNCDLEHLWGNFKNILLEAGKEICGTTKINRGRKQTAWWNTEIKREVQTKKTKWRKYLANKDTAHYEDYKRQREKVKELVLAAKRKSWEEFGHKIEADYHSNQKLFYKVLKNLRSGNKNQTIKQIKSENGTILTTKEDTIKRWKEYFQSLLEGQGEQDRLIQVEENELERQPGNVIETGAIDTSIRRLKRGKAAGHDGITAEMLKSMGERGQELLAKICNLAWKEAKIPEDWKVGVVVPIFKKGDKRECNNYRGITLLSIASKVYERILETKLTREIDTQLEQCQSGFRKGRSIHDHIFTIRQITEKTRDSNSQVLQAFLDLEKAFDRLPRSEIQKALIKKNIDQNLRNAIMSFYVNTRSYVRTDNMHSEEFLVSVGVRQGGVLSPVLFNLVMDEVIKETRGRTSKLFVGYRNMEPVWISECAFADDLVVFAKNETELKKNLNIWNEKLKRKKLKLNEDKTKVMIGGKTNHLLNVGLNGKRLEQVNSFKYLGVYMESQGYQNQEINARIQSAANVYHSMKNSFIGKKEVSTKTKMSVYDSVFVPILIFGCESWVLNKKHKSMLQSMEMKYLRKVLGITRRNRVRNVNIREQLQAQSVISKIENRQLAWFGHLKRMNNDRPVKKVWEAKRTYKRKKGRPPVTWDQSIEKLLKTRGTTRAEASVMAMDRKRWSKFVYGERR